MYSLKWFAYGSEMSYLAMSKLCISKLVISFYILALWQRKSLCIQRDKIK